MSLSGHGVFQLSLSSLIFAMLQFALHPDMCSCSGYLCKIYIHIRMVSWWEMKWHTCNQSVRDTMNSCHFLLPAAPHKVMLPCLCLNHQCVMPIAQYSPVRPSNVSKNWPRKSKKDPVRLRKLRQTSQAAFAASSFSSWLNIAKIEYSSSRYCSLQ